MFKAMKNYLLLLALALFTFGFAACDDDVDDAEDVSTTAESATTTANEELLSTDMIQNPNATTADANAKQPVMTFEKTQHNFGTIKQEEKVEYTFKFTNTGESDLVITDARASCGCTVPTYPKQPIKPGETGEIPVVFDAGKSLNKVSKTVTITANTNPAMQTLTIEANIEPKS